jgi:hypothetical protein
MAAAERALGKRGFCGRRRPLLEPLRDATSHAGPSRVGDAPVGSWGPLAFRREGDVKRARQLAETRARAGSSSPRRGARRA